MTLNVTARLRLLWAALWLAAAGAAAPAQTGSVRQPSLRSVAPNGVRPHLTEGAGTMGFTVTNPTDHEFQLRVLTHYAGALERKYGRDVWVPAHATLSSWFAAGAPARQAGPSNLGLGSLLYDRTGSSERLIRSSEGPVYTESMARYLPRESGTAVMLDADLGDGTLQASGRDEARAEDVRQLVRVFRAASGLSEQVSWVRDRFLPPVAASFDGIELLILATDRLADDDAGLEAVRAWVQRGGRLWVMLDQVQPRTVAALLGEALTMEIVGRAGLTSIPIRNGRLNATRAEDAGLEVEEPVELVRVVTACEPLNTVQGWPAAFVADVGRGKVVFTALGARGWFRPRTERDGPSPYAGLPQLPAARNSFLAVRDELRGVPERPVLAPADLQAYLDGQIGYVVVSRAALSWVFGAFFLVLGASMMVLGRARLSEHLGWIGPALALGAAAVFIVLGERAHNAVPPTVAYAEFVDAASVDEVQLSGQMSVYLAEAGAATAAADQGGDFELDAQGLEGRVVRRVQTDLDRWHWENLDLPAGVRTGPFHARTGTDDPVLARARFAADGLEGRVVARTVVGLEDAVISTPGPRKLAVRVAADGTFRASGADLLPLGEYVAGRLLNDRQRGRQDLYRKAFAEPLPRSLAGRQLLLAWSAPLDPHFVFGTQTHLAGAALWAIPLQLERTPPDTPVIIPAPFLECRRIERGGQSRPPPTEFSGPVDLRLRFQLPRCVWPLRVERARLTARLNAPARPVVLGGYAGTEVVALRHVHSPAGEQIVELEDQRLLQPDEFGGLYASVVVGAVGNASDPESPDTRLLWTMESLELEVRGRTLGSQ